jgi:hypothetical protein
MSDKTLMIIGIVVVAFFLLNKKSSMYKESRVMYAEAPAQAPSPPPPKSTYNPPRRFPISPYRARKPPVPEAPSVPGDAFLQIPANSTLGARHYFSGDTRGLPFISADPVNPSISIGGLGPGF